MTVEQLIALLASYDPRSLVVLTTEEARGANAIALDAVLDNFFDATGEAADHDAGFTSDDPRSRLI